jgi:hypothetical protein
MAAREERLVQNQREFRYANEKLELLSAEMTDDGQLIPFLCECADDHCLGRIEITISRYADTHEDRHHYVVLPGHPRVEGEETVEDNDYYQIVSKGDRLA